ncbi:MAG: carboxylate-amine ligase [Spirochaetaceae bacterium]|nr:carboxylate-amine ligase [Spirochaetaceae bacterium]
MNTDKFGVTFGLEEEFFLVDPDSRDLIADPDPALFDACERDSGAHKVVHELLRTQIETNTRVCTSVADLRQAQIETRSLVINTAAQFGAAVIASSTHPFAHWQAQAVTPKERYDRFAVTFQEVVRRYLVGGMHIHAGFGDAESRIRVMTALRRYLPIMHALSTSSPFNGGRETGFKSFRLTVIASMPRTNLPQPFRTRAEYDRLVSDYQSMDFIGDGTELWWDIRPAVRFPTIEVRICDICPRMEDTLSLAALYACLIRRLLRKDAEEGLPPEPPTELIAENRWHASRYGSLAFLGDFGAGGRTDIQELVAELVEDLAEDAAALDCEQELQRVTEIIRLGTGADRQIDLFRLRRLEGDTIPEALRAVVDMIIAETREGITDPV